MTGAFWLEKNKEERFGGIGKYSRERNFKTPKLLFFDEPFLKGRDINVDTVFGHGY